MTETNWVGITPDPPRYTLDEARIELNKQSCATDGHDYQHIVTHDGQLLRVYCGRCDRSWATAEQ